MKKRKIFTITIFLIVILFILVNALPPNLPTKIYGKVIDKKGNGIPNILVKAIYKNNNGYSKSIATITNTGSNQGDYFFDIQDVLYGEDIKIESGGSYKTLLATPGLIIKVEDIILDDSLKKSQNTLTDKNDILDKFMKFIKELFNSKEISKKNIENKEDTKNNYSDIYEKFKNNKTSNDTSFNNDSNNIKKNEGGKDLDFNLSNKSNSYFDDSKNENLDNIELNKSGSSDDEEYSFKKFTTEPAILKKYSNAIKEIINYNEKEKNNFKLVLFYFLYSLGLLIFIFIVLIFIYLFIKFIKKLVYFFNPLDYSIKKVTNEQTFNFMIKNPDTLNLDNSLIDAIDYFLDKNVNIIPIINNNRVLGTISKMDIVSKTASFDYDSLSKIKVKDILNKNFVFCDSSKKMLDIYTILNEKKVNSIIVLDKGMFKGTVDYFDILNLFSKSDFEIENPPILSECMTKEVNSVNSDADLNKLKNQFINKKIDYAIISEDNKPIGIVTLKDLLGVIKKNPDFKKIKAKNIMTGNMVFMTPGTSINNAIKVVLERRYNQIPIIIDNKIVGIVNVKSLVKGYYEFIARLKEQMKDKKFKKSIKIFEDENP